MSEEPIDPTDPVDLSAVTPDGRERLLDGLCATASELHATQLRAVASMDTAGDWRADGMTSMADWLVYRYRLSVSTSKAWVTAARALAEMPRTAEAYAAGRISFDQLTHALSYASPEDDETLASLLPTLGAAEVEAEAKRRRRVRRAERDEAQRRESLSFRPSASGDMVRMTGLFPVEDAAVVEAALERRAEAMGPDAETGRWAPADHRLARAVVELAADDLADASRTASGDPHLVVVHVPAATIRGHGDAAGSATIGGEPIHDDTLARLLCDTKIEFHVDGPDGTTVGIGRASRTPPPWLRRRVHGRQHGRCGWSGCSRRIRHLHHLRHWSRDGGPTNASNLLGVCWHHHHLLHEGGWEATGNADGIVTFTSPLERVLHARAGPHAA